MKSKKMQFGVVLALAVSAFTAVAAKPAVTVTASLRDGSTVKGDFLTKKIIGATLFERNLVLSPSLVRSINFTGTNGESKVELSNGDRFAMTVSNDVFAVRSLLGDLKVPRASMNAISFLSRSVAAAKGTSAEGLVFHCTFDGRDGTIRPMIGKADIRILNATFAEGKNGVAMRVQRGLPAVELNFPPRTFGNKGCIEFWAKLIDGKTEFSTGGDPRFFTLYSGNGGQIGLLEYASNSGNGNKGLWGGLMAGFAATHPGYVGMMPYSDVFHGKPYEDWHHYAISWNTNGVGSSADSELVSNRVVLFIDGKKVSTVHKVGMSEMMEEVLGAPTLMGIPMYERGPSYNNKASFLIDDLKIWNSDKTTFDL